MQPKKCPQCGKELPAQYEGRYCLNCGTVFSIGPVAGRPAEPAATRKQPSARRKTSVGNVLACFFILGALVWMFATVYQVLLK